VCVCVCVCLSVCLCVCVYTSSLCRLVNPTYDMDTYIFKVNVFTKQATSE